MYHLDFISTLTDNSKDNKLFHNVLTKYRKGILLLSSYHHLEWLALIGNNSDLTSFSTLSELIMKLKHTLSTKTPAEVKELEIFFMKPKLQEPRN